MNRFALWWATTPVPLRWLMSVIGGLYALFLLAALVASVAPAVGIVLTGFDALTFQPARPAFAWTFLTHVFVNPSVGLWPLVNVVVAVLFLSTLGRDALDLLGERWLYGALASAALGASLFAFAVHAGLGYPERLFGPWTLVLGLAMALGVRFPDKSIGMMLVGNVRLVILVPVLVFIGALLSASFVPVIGDIGAALGAAAYAGLGAARVGLPARMPRKSAARPDGRSSRTDEAPPPARAARSERRGASTRASTSDVDRILEKISASGLGSLTADERRVLEEASRR